ncbi:MAG: polyphosphate kinase 1 [Bacteroidetes bacterium]|nr:polyphosphate kinase 1 [Bacteroidota bacterium]
MELFNRELSWLSFNERVLQESLDPSNPLIERMRFLGIYSNNMDEFFRVRVASVIRLVELKQKKVEGFSGGPSALLKEVRKRVLEQQQQFEISYQKLLVELRANNILIAREEDLNNSEKEYLANYFRDVIRPAIVPIMLSTKRPMPQLQDRDIYLAVKMISFDKSKVKYALIAIPKTSPRFVTIPTTKNDQKKMIIIDDIIRLHLPEIFTIFFFDDICAYTCKITRDAELDVDDDISKSFIEKMRDSVAMRKLGETVRFVYDSSMPIDMLRYLMNAMKLEAGENIIPGGRYHNFKDFMNFPDFGLKNFVFEKQKPVPHPAFSGKEPSLLKTILKQDILLNFPFQTFQHVIDILREAAIDPKVLSIKMNLYRVAPDSQIINTLISAAQNGKKVTVIIELKARFDEVNNIRWSNFLEENGVIVMFGVPNLKVHSKLFIIKRKNGDKTEVIAHIGSGNFHEKTARVYTDCSLLTANPVITKEVDKIFKILKNNLDRSIFRELFVSPFNMRRKINSLIDTEIENAQAGKKAYIHIKLNNLIDSAIIKKLYEASQAGVQIDCVIRGICGLIPGMKGVSENIRVRSIIGRYLEHSRILIFANGGHEKYFISSADWMERNIDRRIEVTTPVLDKEIQKELRFIFDCCMKDNQKARIVDAQQKNKKIKADEEKAFNSQNELYAYFCEKAKNR